MTPAANHTDCPESYSLSQLSNQTSAPPEGSSCKNASGRTIVIVAYKPKPGKEADLLQLTREHVPCFDLKVSLPTTL
jgi:hypothetical protein